MYHVTVNNNPKGINNARLPAQFRYVQELNPAATQNQGRPVYENVLYIKIADNLYNIIDRRATAQDRLRYQQELATFEAKNQRMIDGTPLDVLFNPESGLAAFLRTQNIYTVEELAKSAHEYSPKAQRYLESMSNARDFLKLEEQIQLRDHEIYILKQEIQLLKSKLENYKSNQERMETEGFIDSNPPNTPGYDHQKANIDARGRERK